MNGFMGRQRTVTARMRLGFGAEAIWPLLCPVREYDWIEDWRCRMIQSAGGVNELGCVFTTRRAEDGGDAAGDDVWVTSRFEPFGRLEFVRVNRLRAVRFEIAIEPDGDGTRLTWTQHLTSLCPDGDAVVAAMTRERFAAIIARLEQMLDHYLRTGTMLRSQPGMADARDAW